MSEAHAHPAGERPFERLDELLIGRALGDLDLLDYDPSLDHEGYELAAAAFDLALDGREEPMPSHLRERVIADADLFFGAQQSVSRVAPVRRAPSPAPTRRGAWQALATVAVLVLVVWVGWSVRGGDPTPSDPGLTREQILASGDYVQWDWVGTEDPTVGQVSGDVVWGLEAGTGTMRIGGLAANDPGEFQYQLWIFDRSRDERYPVDGGVFDVPENGGEVLIPIDPKLPVDRPYLFAITVERPGGVVVSSRERIAILAQPPSEG